MLNDLNNLSVNGRKLQEQEKREIVELVKSKDAINMKKIIESVMDESIDVWSGARVDKNDKEIFHKFEVYNKMRKALAEIGVDITDYSRDELDEVGKILTINTDKEAILEGFEHSFISLEEETIECLITVRKKNGSLFNKWHSFSLKICKLY